jgi:hypothetical protein
MPDMPPGFPTVDKFAPNKVKEHTADWDFHRSPNTGGQNYGVDLVTPNESAMVGFTVNVASDHNTKGSPDIHIKTTQLGVVTVPSGVHVGHRLEPGGIGGPGARFKGTVVMQVVSIQDWLPVALGLATG